LESDGVGDAGVEGSAPALDFLEQPPVPWEVLIDFEFNDAPGFKRTIVAVYGGERKPQTPKQAAAKEKEAGLVMTVIRKAAEVYLAEVTGRWSQREFADRLWHHLRLQGHEIAQNTVRTHVQKGAMLPPLRMKEK
jgi:hypothetical protein